LGFGCGLPSDLNPFMEEVGEYEPELKSVD
jgi:hypothetical protein